MITIEGLGGKGGVWCALCFAKTSVTKITDVDAYAFDSNGILSAPPCAVYLPPVRASSLWYSCTTSPYGPRLDRFEVGTLDGVTSSPDTPNPCEHSTMTGGLMCTGAGPLGVPRWVWPKVQPLNGVTYYTPSGDVAQFVQGTKSDWLGDEHAYNRFGILVADYDGSHTETNAMLTDWCDPVGSTNPLYTFGATQSMWLCTTQNRAISTEAKRLVKTSCTHVSARVWKESKMIEYHQNASYTPIDPVSKETGLGYTIAFAYHVRTITMQAIQSTSPTHFNGRYAVEETISYGYRATGISKPLITGSVSMSYSFDAKILTLAPGLAVGDTFLKAALDGYCHLAQPRAKLLFQMKCATTARSNAIADVTGLQSNWIENLSQVKGTASAIRPLVNAWKAVKTGNIMAGKRALIDAYLTYMYVVSPGVRDYNDVTKNLGKVSRNITSKRFSSERRRGKMVKTVPTCDVLAELAYYCTLNLRLKDNPIASLGNALERLGLNPSAANIWDLIPFSFVVDWFVHIGPILSRLDAYENNALLRDVESRVETFKVLWPLTKSQLIVLVGDRYSIVTPIKYSWYDRRILTGLGSYDPFSGQSSGGLSVSQMTQGGALLSSYKK